VEKKKKKYYPDVDQNLNIPKMEELILEYWNSEKIFEKSVDMRNGESYVFYDGPPFATGLPHQGHLVANYTKDTVARYHTMLGKKVERIFGWDCHGLPAEMGVEKQSGISGRKAIEEYGIDKFNGLCRDFVLKYVNEWRYYVNRMGRWVDFENDYKTMNLSYMETTIWIFKQLYDKGLVYEDYRVMPYSWACQTPLSNFETRQDNSYREKADKSVTVKFKLKESFRGYDNVFLLAWTTVPWTLTSNLALAINNNIDYILIKNDINSNTEEYLVLCKESLKKYKKEIGGNIVDEFKGSELLGLYYEPILPYLTELPEVKASQKVFSVLHGDHVVTNEGTGIVSTAPGFGEIDNIICKGIIPTICPIDDGGKFIAPINDFINVHVFDTNDPIILKMKEQGSWVKTEQILHNYPHCWRTDTPLIYRALSSWYVKVTSIKDNLIKNNEEINWIPDHVKHGRFGKWLEGVKDWSITRNRFWGCPVPVWKSNDPKYPRIDVYGSIADLERDFGVKIEDLHRPYIDNLKRPNPDDPTGKSMMVRVADVMDCWFESGSMPYAQHHYPFERKDWFDKNFPANFVTEGDGQLRGWFYVLLVLSVALFDKPSFKNCISTGVVVDETGKKLSKRLGNYTDISEIFKLYGSDSLRWFMMKSPVLKGEELRMDKEAKDIKDTFRMSIKPIINSYNFFCMYANSDGIKAELITKSNNLMDTYILSKMKITIENIKKEMDNYSISVACREGENFFEILNNWYIRRNKNRFWKSDIDGDKILAYNTLYTVLNNLTKALAPLLPFTTEFIWRGINKNHS
jgi:isoleucyl-tRNA synthetase